MNITGIHNGDLTLHDDSTVSGIVTGDIFVTAGHRLRLLGICNGNVVLSPGAEADTTAGILNGRIIRGADTISLPQQRRAKGRSVPLASENKHYDVALSFAGEDRRHAESLAFELMRRDVTVFYDLKEQACLWGKDLYVYLQEIYRNRSHFCVVFISRNYARKLWTRHELRQAQERSFIESSEYILPIRLDETVLPGMQSTTGCIRLTDFSISRIADMVMDKLAQRKRP